MKITLNPNAKPFTPKGTDSNETVEKTHQMQTRISPPPGLPHPPKIRSGPSPSGVDLRFTPSPGIESKLPFKTKRVHFENADLLMTPSILEPLEAEAIHLIKLEKLPSEKTIKDFLKKIDKLSPEEKPLFNKKLLTKVIKQLFSVQVRNFENSWDGSIEKLEFFLNDLEKIYTLPFIFQETTPLDFKPIISTLKSRIYKCDVKFLEDLTSFIENQKTILNQIPTLQINLIRVLDYHLLNAAKDFSPARLIEVLRLVSQLKQKLQSLAPSYEVFSTLKSIDRTEAKTQRHIENGLKGMRFRTYEIFRLIDHYQSQGFSNSMEKIQMCLQATVELMKQDKRIRENSALSQDDTNKDPILFNVSIEESMKILEYTHSICNPEIQSYLFPEEELAEVDWYDKVAPGSHGESTQREENRIKKVFEGCTEEEFTAFITTKNDVCYLVTQLILNTYNKMNNTQKIRLLRAINQLEKLGHRDERL